MSRGARDMIIDRSVVLLAAVLSFVPVAAFAHGETHPTAGAAVPMAAEQTPFGIAGDPAAATRTVKIDMSDRMRFTPDELVVKNGETVRFVLRNSGATLHEMVIGTKEGLKEHAEMMRKHPGMEHEEPYMAHVKPGASGEIVWKFNRKGTFQFACLIPGHFEAGMVGRVVVR